MQTKQVYSQYSTKSPLVSFIIPCYNLPSDMIRECLDSILALSLSDSEREIIVIDDGSDVSPLNDLLRYRDKIIYIRQANKGLSGARNTGITMASGKYIQFVDGDDTLIPTTYEHCLDLVRYQNPDIVQFRFTTDRKKDYGKETEFTFDEPVTGADYMRHNNLRASPCEYVFRRKLLGTLRFHQGILHEDEEFTPQLILRADKLIETKARAYFYRQRKGSIIHNRSKRWSLRRLNDMVEVLTVLRDRTDTLPYNDRTALQRRIDQLTMDYLYNVIVLTRNGHYLEKCISRLHEKGLFPLPARDYTRKYKYFRKMINTNIGRKILLAALPRL